MFIDIGLDVSWRDLKIDVTGRNTSRVFKPEEERIGHVIDHIMYDPRKIKAVDGGIIELDKPLSDHKPVFEVVDKGGNLPSRFVDVGLISPSFREVN